MQTRCAEQKTDDYEYGLTCVDDKVPAGTAHDERALARHKRVAKYLKTATPPRSASLLNACFAALPCRA